MRKFLAPFTELFYAGMRAVVALSSLSRISKAFRRFR